MTLTLTQAVTGMDQHITIRNLGNMPVQAVSIRYSDEFHRYQPRGARLIWLSG